MSPYRNIPYETTVSDVKVLISGAMNNAVNVVDVHVRSPPGRSLHQTSRLPRVVDLLRGLCALGICRFLTEELVLRAVVWEEQAGPQAGGV